LAMQYPVEVPGVSVSNFLRTAKTAIDGKAPALRHWVSDVRTTMEGLRIDPAFSERNVNEGFSGGEKKRHEILQLELLKPKFAVLDETDSGLDVDALRVVSQGVNRVRSNTDVGIMLITHYTRILRYITPDFVHVFVNGRVAEQGGPELAKRLEAEGYDRFLTPAGAMSTTETAPLTAAELAAVRADFPLLERTARDKSLVYLDSAATAQKPECVIDAEQDFYLQHNAAVHRGAHALAEEATADYERARELVAGFVGAGPEEVVFTKNATE